MNKLHLTRRKAIIAGLLIPSLSYTVLKGSELAADPSAEKDCACAPIENNNESTCDAPAGSATTATALAWKQQGGTINDASCVNRTAVHGIVQVKTEDDIRAALRYAAEKQLKVSIAAVRHSMGGHAFHRNGVVLDMMQFNNMSLDAPNKLLTVQSGATWHNIQNFIHPNYAVKAMQSSDIFSVGGSVSVNAHGMDHQVGAVGRTIRSMRVMLPDGSIKTASRNENPELFNLVLGGYGLFGILLDVVLEITDNTIYQAKRRYINVQDFPALFQSEIVNDKKLGLFYGHLSTSPGSLLREMILYLYEAQTIGEADIPPLPNVSGEQLRRFTLNFAKLGPIPARLKWFAEKNIEPHMETCSVKPRSQALTDGEACLVARNEPMHDSVNYLKNNLKGETDILHEYFIPRDRLIAFVDGLREVVIRRSVNLLNASVRVVHREDNFLSYAPQDAFSIVLYINQQTDAAGHAKMRLVTGELIDLATRLGGRFFLPYQLHYTPQQLEASYPQIRQFFAAKQKYDPQGLLTNTWYEKYRGM
ncbi:MAG: FAD-binding oxidoreductase [Chloroflexota bacterium]